MNFAVRLDDLHKNYDLGDDVVRVLKGLQLEIPLGDYVAIMGTSGSGKSTLLNVLGCLDRPTSGEFMLGQDDISQLDDDSLSEIRSSQIGFVFQSFNLISSLTVLENIEAPLYYRGHITAQGRQRCHELAKLVGLADRLHHRPSQLSGGQQQRAAIARSLVNNPRFILADEPTGNLDSSTTEEILDLLDQLNAEGKTIIMVTHEEDVAQRARRIIRLKDGVIQSDIRLREPDPQQAQLNTESAKPSQNNLTSVMSVLMLQLLALQLGVKNLVLHPLRSLLTVLGIFIGVASVIWLLAIGEGISEKAQQQIAELGATNIILTTDRPPPEAGERRVEHFGVTLLDFQRLKEIIPSIEQASPSRDINRQEFRHGERVMLGELHGCTLSFMALNHLEVDRGHFITDVEVEQNRMVCVLSAEVAEKLFSFDDPIGQSILVHSTYYRVVGVMKSRGEMSEISGEIDSQDFSDNVYIPITTYWARVYDFWARTPSGIPVTTQVTLKVRDPAEVLETAEIVRKSMEKWHETMDYRVTVPLELLERARSTRIMFIVLLGLIAAISLVVGGIGIMNIMLATVTERTREIGIRRALGARRWDITRQFLAETIVLSIVGGGTGVLGGITCRPIFIAIRAFVESALPEVMESIPESIQNVTPIIVPWSIPLSFGISMVVGVVFGLYPAIRAAAMNPIEALRHVA